MENQVVIRKYQIGRVPFYKATVYLHADTKVLHTNLQDDFLCVWVLTNPTTELNRKVNYEMYCTGETIENIETLRFITTIFDSGYVGHVFERL